MGGEIEKILWNQVNRFPVERGKHPGQEDGVELPDCVIEPAVCTEPGPDHVVTRGGENNRVAEPLPTLLSENEPVIAKRVEGPQGEDVGIKIYTAAFFENLKADHIGLVGRMVQPVSLKAVRRLDFLKSGDFPDSVPPLALRFGIAEDGQFIGPDKFVGTDEAEILCEIESMLRKAMILKMDKVDEIWGLHPLIRFLSCRFIFFPASLVCMTFSCAINQDCPMKAGNPPL